MANVMQRDKATTVWFGLLASLCGAVVQAQPCDGQWVSGGGVPGLDSPAVAAVMWDPDGSGPDPSRLVVSGGFRTAGATRVVSCAAWDGERWSAVGTQAVTVRASLPNGDLIASGVMTGATGVEGSHIARWNGASWVPIGAPFTFGGAHGVLHAVAVLPNGNIVAGGRFTAVGNTPASHIAQWNGSSWQPLSGGVNSTVYALAVLQNGDLIAAGQFTGAAGAGHASAYVARWNGESWFALGSGVGGLVYCLLAMPDGGFIAGGAFNTAGSIAVGKIARWDGAEWRRMSSGMNDYVRSLVLLPNNEVVASGMFTVAGGASAPRRARWNGSVWSPLLPARAEGGDVLCVMPNGDLVASGDFQTVSGGQTIGIARYETATPGWHRMGPAGLNGPVGASVALPNGSAVLAGSFTSAGDVAAGYVVGLTEDGFEALGSGIRGWGGGWVGALAALSNGDVIAGGDFSQDGGSPGNNIARWNGIQWLPMGSGVGGYLGSTTCVAALPGDAVIAGVWLPEYSYITRWNGTSWTSLPGTFVRAPFGGSVLQAFAVLANGDIIVGGEFSSAGSTATASIARWNGSSWAPLGNGLRLASAVGIVSSLQLMHDGSLVAGGLFSIAGDAPANNIARWDGVSWSPLGAGLNGRVNALALLPNGDLVAGGAFSAAGGVPAAGLARWDGTTWVPFSSQLGRDQAGWGIGSLSVLPNGDLLVGGSFHLAAESVSAFWAKWVSDPVPRFAFHPEPQAVSSGSTIVLTAANAPGFNGVSFQWYRDGTPVTNGPAGASFGGGVATGALGAFPSPSDGAPIQLAITDAQPSDAGVYTVVFSNACGEAVSEPAVVTVTGGPAPCLPDWNADGLVNSTDISAFLTAWLASIASGDLTADFNADGQVNSSDISAFLAAWLAAVQNGGC